MSGVLLPGVRKIAFFRPNAVGDFVFALPALRALRRAYPQAELLYLGRAWHADFLRGRRDAVDRVVIVPDEALTPSSEEGARAREAFVAAMRAEDIDVAIQAYGGGAQANPLLRQLGARLCVGFQAPQAEPLDLVLPYVGMPNRRLQMLELVALIGAQGLWPDVEWTCAAEDHEAARALLPAVAGQPLVLLQPGATDPRRRWPTACFAAVGDHLAAKGAQVAVHGSASEARLVAEVCGAMRHAAVDLAGRASLKALSGLLDRARLLVSNDTGPLHLALALRRPAVGIYWLSNLVESSPLWQAGHHPLMATRTHCPVCGQDNVRERCPHDVSFVDDIGVSEVCAEVDEIWAQPMAWPGPPVA